MISDQVMAVNLATSRGASEAVRVRTLREGVAQIKQALEIAVDADERPSRSHGRIARRKMRADDAVDRRRNPL